MDSTISSEIISSEDRWCTTCLHVATNRDGDSSKYRCFSPRNFIGINVVDGTKIQREPLCKDQRYPSGEWYEGERCTTEGNWWEPKPTTLPYTVDDIPAPSLAAKNKTEQIRALIKNKTTKPSSNLADALGM